MLRAEAAAAVGLVALAIAATGGATHDRTLSDPRITESSDLVASSQHPGLVWTTNDSGDKPRIFGVNAQGHTVAVLTLRGARARDWEALAPGRAADGRPLLWVGDIGDNLSTWPSVRVYRVVEPTRLGDQDVKWTGYDLRFPDGSRDAETLLVDPSDQRVYVISKRVEGAAVYEAPAHLRTDRVNVLTRIASAPALITDGSFSPDGKTVAIRDYVWAWRSDSILGPWHRMNIPLQPQGESLTWTPEGRAVLIGSEGVDSLVWRVPMTSTSSAQPSVSATAPTEAPSTPSPSQAHASASASTSGTPATTKGSGRSSGWRLLIGGLALGAALSVAVAARRRNTGRGVAGR